MLIGEEKRCRKNPSGKLSWVPMRRPKPSMGEQCSYFTVVDKCVFSVQRRTEEGAGTREEELYEKKRGVASRGILSKNRRKSQEGGKCSKLIFHSTGGPKDANFKERD